MAGLLGFLFGTAANLLESHYFSRLSTDPDRDSGSAMYGLILSLCGATIMFTAHTLRMVPGSGFLGTALFLFVITSIAIVLGFHFLKHDHA